MAKEIGSREQDIAADYLAEAGFNVKVLRSFFEQGQSYFIRSVPNYIVGRVDSFVLNHGQTGAILLDQAAWVANTGRFHDALVSSDFSEVEPFPRKVLVGLDFIPEATDFLGVLPLQQK